MANKALYIEGTTDTTNGNLRQGFNKLLSKVLEGRMPRIIMGNSKNSTIDKFKHNNKADTKYILIDSDCAPAALHAQIKTLCLEKFESELFFMIQEMETWFISQPKVLDLLYHEKISDKIPHRPLEEIPSPASLLEEITRNNTTKGMYHKVRHGTDLLENLDATQLRIDFNQFDNLVKALA